MSLLGKILVILNVFGALGLICLAAADYAKRQAWAYNVFRADLILQGLPLDSAALTPEGQPVVELINDDTKKLLFPTGTAVLTQEEEVKRVQQQVQGRLQASGSDISKALADYAEVLLPFAQTNPQRELLEADLAFLGSPEKTKPLLTALEQSWDDAKVQKSPAEAFRDGLARRRLDGDPRPLVDRLLPLLLEAKPDKLDEAFFRKSLEPQRPELVAQLDELFNRALNVAKPAETGEQRRKNIARLLFNLAEEEPDPAKRTAAVQRFITVVGLRSAVPAVQDETRNLAGLIRDVENERSYDRTRFAVAHYKVLEAVREKAQAVEAATALLARKQKEQAAHEEELKKRQRDVRQFKEELDDSRRLTAERMKDLTEMTKQLYKVRIALREATQKNQDYEKEIRSLEAKP